MAFLLSVLFYQSQHERQFRVSLLENRLEGYSDLVDKYIKLEHSVISKLKDEYLCTQTLLR